MGWNSWDCYGASVTEDILKKNADYMSQYLKPYGWEYIVCDIQWYEVSFCGREMVLSLSPGPAVLSEAEHLETKLKPHGAAIFKLMEKH